MLQGGDVKCIDSGVDSDLVKEDKALWPCLLALSHTCISPTHFLTSCLAKCFSAAEITVSNGSDFIELEEKADGKGEDEKRFRERWIEIILLRWYTHNRHGLYLWLDCFFRRIRKVPFQYNTDIHSALYAWNLKAFSSFSSLFSTTDVLWTADDFSSSSGSNSMADKDCSHYRWAQKDRSCPKLNHSPFLALLSWPPRSSSHHHGVFPGICLSSGSPDICCPVWICPGWIWHNVGPDGTWCWATSQCLWRCALIPTPRD